MGEYDPRDSVSDKDRYTYTVHRAGMRIKTHHAYPPIPIRDFDWQAWDADTYDGDHCPVGYGKTEEEAIADLISQTEEVV